VSSLIFRFLIPAIRTLISSPPSLILEQFKLFPKSLQWTANTRTSFGGLWQKKGDCTTKNIYKSLRSQVQVQQDQEAYNSRPTKFFNECGSSKLCHLSSRPSPGDSSEELWPLAAELQDIPLTLMNIAVPVA
jgi:hypothetical protein